MQSLIEKICKGVVMKKLLKIFALALPSVVFSADLTSIVNKISSWIQTALTAIGTIIIIAVAIYFMKNLDRWKEIFLVCLGIVLATLGIMNAQAISFFLFSS